MPFLCHLRNCSPFDVVNGEVDFARHLVGEPEVGFLDQAVGGDGDDFQHLGPADCGDEAGGPRLAGDGHAVERFAELLFLCFCGWGGFLGIVGGVWGVANVSHAGVWSVEAL